MKMKKAMPRAFGGFTLVEILVVISILAIIVVAGSNMFFTLLRGSNKTKVLQSAKQNGNYAISVMERMIRNARNISGSGSSIVIQNPDGQQTTFECCGTSPDLMIASRSGTLTCQQTRLTSGEVKVSSCPAVFSVVSGVIGTKPAVVTIKFSLSQAGITTRPEEQATIDFQTTVSLRNY